MQFYCNCTWKPNSHNACISELLFQVQNHLNLNKHIVIHYVNCFELLYSISNYNCFNFIFVTINNNILWIGMNSNDISHNMMHDNKCNSKHNYNYCQFLNTHCGLHNTTKHFVSRLWSTKVILFKIDNNKEFAIILIWQLIIL